MSEALVRRIETVELEIVQEVATLYADHDWSIEELESAQQLRIQRSRHRVRPYRPNNNPPFVYFSPQQVVKDGHIRPDPSPAAAYVPQHKQQPAASKGKPEGKTKRAAAPSKPAAKPVVQPTSGKADKGPQGRPAPQSYAEAARTKPVVTRPPAITKPRENQRDRESRDHESRRHQQVNPKPSTPRAIVELPQESIRNRDRREAARKDHQDRKTRRADHRSSIAKGAQRKEVQQRPLAGDIMAVLAGMPLADVEAVVRHVGGSAKEAKEIARALGSMTGPASKSAQR
jgi:hypothetical protein